jgi:hypothetical protein
LFSTAELFKEGEMKAMNREIEPGLKGVFVIGAIGSLLSGGLSIVAPGLVTSISGLDPAAGPAIQQAGAATLGYFVLAVFGLRATTWDEVKAIVAGSLTFTALSTIGSFYYVVLMGFYTPGLIGILIASVILTVGFAYYWLRYARPTQMEARHEPA